MSGGGRISFQILAVAGRDLIQLLALSLFWCGQPATELLRLLYRTRPAPIFFILHSCPGRNLLPTVLWTETGAVGQDAPRVLSLQVIHRKPPKARIASDASEESGSRHGLRGLLRLGLCPFGCWGRERAPGKGTIQGVLVVWFYCRNGGLVGFGVLSQVVACRHDDDAS